MNEPNKLPTITITITDPMTFDLRLEGHNLPSVDYALNMLHQAVRVWEAERLKAVQLDIRREAERELLKDGPRIVRPS